MADLDDFFKKRDKKKKTAAKTKFVTLDTDEFAKQLEATSIRNIEDEGEFQENSEFTTQFANPLTTGDNLDEEWKPFDSEDNKDYTGLRIKIQNWKVEDEENNNEGVNDEQEKKVSCPWGSCTGANKQEEQPVEEKKTSTEQSLETPVEAQTEVSKSEPTSEPAQSAPSTTSAYVPPHLRKKETTESGKYVPPSLRNKPANDSAIPPTSVNFRRPNKSQPNIMDTMEFPTLGADNAPSDKMTNGTEKFELPKKAGRVESKSGNTGAIDLENKFTALSNN